MKETLQFLRELAVHNNKEWFDQNRTRYKACRERFERFTDEYIRRLTEEVDPTLKGLKAKDCIWRINRDIRFSNDKRPYKEWFGAFPAAGGGKKSPQGGYYVHIQPGNCMFAAGIWCPEKDLLRGLRDDIVGNYDELEEIMASPAFQEYFTDFDTDYMLTRVPAGYDADFVHADWLKRKTFTISTPLTDKQVCAPDFMDQLIRIAKAAYPINRFLNYRFN